MKTALHGGCIVLLALCAPALAQTPEGRVVIPGQGQGTITFFERPDFGGAAVTYRQSEANIRVPFFVRSVRAEGVWRICTGTNFAGRCVLADSSYRDAQGQLGLMLSVGSVEARGGGDQSHATGQTVEQGWQGQNHGWQGQAVPPGQGTGWYGPPGGPTLRGTNVQLFAAPEIGRERLESCAGGNPSNSCAAQTADRFCAYAGWGRALNFGVQWQGRRSVLIDVVCGNR